MSNTFHKDCIEEYLYETIWGRAAEIPSQITDDLHQVLQKLAALCLHFSFLYQDYKIT